MIFLAKSNLSYSCPCAAVNRDKNKRLGNKSLQEIRNQQNSLPTQGFSVNSCLSYLVIPQLKEINEIPRNKIEISTLNYLQSITSLFLVRHYNSSMEISVTEFLIPSFKFQIIQLQTLSKLNCQMASPNFQIRCPLPTKSKYLAHTCFQVFGGIHSPRGFVSCSGFVALP